MKRTTRNVVISLAVAAVLGGAVAALNFTKPQTKKFSESSRLMSSTTTPLINRQAKDFKSMKVTNKHGSYVIINNQTKNQPKMTVKGIENLPVDHSQIDDTAVYGYAVFASKNLGEVKNLKEYGLDKPQATVESTLTDGKTFRYSIGRSSPDSAGYYILVNDKVYIAALSDHLLGAKKDFVSKVILNIVPDKARKSDKQMANANKFTKIELTGKRFPKSVEIIYKDSKNSTNAYIMTKPYQAGVDTMGIQNILQSLSRLTASDIAKIYPTDSELKDFGLVNPKTRIKFTVNGKNYILRVGNLKGESRYVMLEGVSAVYLVEDKSIASWADTTAFKLRQGFVYITMITRIEKMTVSQNNQTDVFKVSRKEDTKSSTEDQKAYQYELTGNNGKKLTYDLFKKYYQNVISIQLLEPSEEKVPARKPDISVRYDYFNGDKSTIIDFYKLENRRYLAVVNGEVNGTVSAQSVQNLQKDTKSMQNNVNVQEQ